MDMSVANFWEERNAYFLLRQSYSIPFLSGGCGYRYLTLLGLQLFCNNSQNSPLNEPSLLSSRVLMYSAVAELRTRPKTSPSTSSLRWLHPRMGSSLSLERPAAVFEDQI